MRIFDRLGAQIREPHTQERRLPDAPRVEDFAGVIFGRPSAFPGSVFGRESRNGSTIETRGDPPEFKRIIPGNLKIYSREARVSEDGDPEAATFVDVDRFQRLMFYFTEFPPKPIPSLFQQSFTTYYDLHFDLHPPTDTETELD